MPKALLPSFNKTERVHVVYQEADTTHEPHDKKKIKEEIQKPTIVCKANIVDEFKEEPHENDEDNEEICVDECDEPMDEVDEGDDDDNDDEEDDEINVVDDCEDDMYSLKYANYANNNIGMSERTDLPLSSSRNGVNTNDPNKEDPKSTKQPNSGSGSNNKEVKVNIGSSGYSAFSRCDRKQQFVTSTLEDPQLRSINGNNTGFINMDLVTNPLLRSLELKHSAAILDQQRLQTLHWIQLASLHHQQLQQQQRDFIANQQKSGSAYHIPYHLGYLPTPVPHLPTDARLGLFSHPGFPTSNPSSKFRNKSDSDVSSPEENAQTNRFPSDPHRIPSKGLFTDQSDKSDSSPECKPLDLSPRTNQITSFNHVTRHESSQVMSSPVGSFHGNYGVGFGVRRPRDPNKPPALKKYKCDLCGKAFSRSNTLVTHRRIHTGEKPFPCELCGRAFRQPGNLTRHRLTHTSHKPYVCPVCQKAFNRASNLQTHMKTHSNFKPFSCHCCNQTFQSKVDLKMHMYVHGPAQQVGGANAAH